MSKKTGGHGSAARIIFGILFMYFLWVIMILPALLVNFVVGGDSTTITVCYAVPAAVGFILLLFNYAFLGVWFMEFGAGASGAGGARNPILRFFGSIFGIIGFFIRPFPIMIYGANKKKYLYFSVVIPLAAIGIVCVVVGVVVGHFTFFVYSGILAIIHALFVLSIKKCPNCGCVMSGQIDYDYLDSRDEVYTKERSREVGSVDLGDAGSATVYEHYDVAFQGRRTTYAKTFTCLNCGTKRQGRKFSASERASEDY